jgi:hypothetical protein
MNNPGSIQLTCGGAAFQIAAPGVYTGDWIKNLQGARSVSLQASFKYGAGGTSVAVFVQTSLDGQTAMDVWSPVFTTENAGLAVNLNDSAVTSPVSPTNQGLSPNSVVNGFIGDRFRVVAVVLGEYTAGTILNVTAVVR